MMEALNQVLEQFGQRLGSPFKLDKHNTCKIMIEKSFPISIELSTENEQIVLGCTLGELPPGKVRENILREALKANVPPHLTAGTLAFSTRTNQLILCALFPVHKVNGETLESLFTQFVKKAKVWREALSRGQTPLLETASSSDNKPKGPFGLKS